MTRENNKNNGFLFAYRADSIAQRRSLAMDAPPSRPLPLNDEIRERHPGQALVF
jgi:hypothetical protein